MKVKYEAVAYSHVLHDRNQWRAVVNRVVNIGLYWRRDTFFLIGEVHISFLQKILLGAVSLILDHTGWVFGIVRNYFSLSYPWSLLRFHWYVCSSIANDSSIFPCITFNRWIACSTDFRLAKLFRTFEWSNNGTAKRNIVIEFLNSSKQFRKEQPVMSYFSAVSERLWRYLTNSLC